MAEVPPTQAKGVAVRRVWRTPCRRPIASSLANGLAGTSGSTRQCDRRAWRSGEALVAESGTHKNACLRPLGMQRRQRLPADAAPAQRSDRRERDRGAAEPPAVYRRLEIHRHLDESRVHEIEGNENGGTPLGRAHNGRYPAPRSPGRHVARGEDSACRSASPSTPVLEDSFRAGQADDDPARAGVGRTGPGRTGLQSPEASRARSGSEPANPLVGRRRRRRVCRPLQGRGEDRQSRRAAYATPGQLRPRGALRALGGSGRFRLWLRDRSHGCRWAIPLWASGS